MPVDRRLWKEPMGRAYSPRWPCPSCAHGTLRLIRNTLRYEETRESQRKHNREDFHDMDIDYAFSAFLECGQCAEKISCCGGGGYDVYYIQDEEGDPKQDYEQVFYPKFFYKPMILYRAPGRCPRPAKDQLHRSFAVFFCDLGAAANHVRQCVEEILTHAGIDARNAQDQFIHLSRRIELFQQSDQDNAERADALRWIGNFGSHPEALTKNDLFDAYDILEALMEDLYVGHQRSVREMVAQINRARAPRRRR